MRFASEALIERALPVTIEVEGDISETGRFQALGNSRGHFGRHRAGKFVERDFDARQIVVEAHAELTKAEFAEGGFTLFDHRKTLRSDFRSIGQARGKAGGCGTIPS